MPTTFSHQLQPRRFHHRPRRGAHYIPPGLGPSDFQQLMSHVNVLVAATDTATTTTITEGGSTDHVVVCHKSLRTRSPDLKKKHDVDVCAICLEDLNEENAKIAILECRHEYHENCIKRWLVSKNLCPICRAYVS